MAIPRFGAVVSEPDTRVALAARGVTKRFPGVIANENVDFEVLGGEVHALLGENGSGKTTLCKMLTGMYQPTAGHIEVDGERVVLHSPADAHHHGIFMVHQHFSLVERLTVAENVMLGWSLDGARIRFKRRRAEEEVARLAEEYEMPVAAGKTIAELSIGERQRVEILKALCRGAKVLILDEPTTVLTPQEAERLFASMRRLAQAGNSVIFISHKLHEVLAVSDRVSVLRRGVMTGTVRLGDHGASVDRKELARMMVGREIELGRRQRAARSQQTPAAGLEITEVVVHNELGARVVDRVTLSVAAGEVLGIAGVAGNGQRELAEAIAGRAAARQRRGLRRRDPGSLRAAARGAGRGHRVCS